MALLGFPLNLHNVFLHRYVSYAISLFSIFIWIKDAFERIVKLYLKLSIVFKFVLVSCYIF